MSFVATLAIVTLSAALLVWLLQRIGQSPVIAYLVLGIAFGPNGLGLLQDRTQLTGVADLGVVLLMFFIGLEFHLSDLRRMALVSGAGGALQVFVTAALVFLGSLAFGLRPLEGVVIGVLFAFSSTALVLKAYEDRNESDSFRAQASLALLLGQDVLAIVAMAVLPLLATHPAHASAIHSPLLRLVLPVVLLSLVPWLRRALPWLFARIAVARSQEMFALFALGTCVTMALVAELSGASVSLGAFLGGLVLAGTPFAHQIRADLSTIRNLALGVFFVTVGSLLDLGFLVSHLPLVLLGLVVLIALKAVVVAVVLLAFRHPLTVAGGVGLALAQVGEFSFVLAATAETAGILHGTTYQSLLALALPSMLLTPLLVSKSASFGNWIDARFSRAPAPAAQPEPARTREQRSAGDVTVSLRKTHTMEMAIPRAPRPGQEAVIVGYGIVGRTVARVLLESGVQVNVVDLNLETTRELAAIGRTAIYGDAAKWEVLQAAGVERARWLVVAVPDLRTRASVVATARAHLPRLVIYTRGRILAERSQLMRAGANHISFEEAEVTVGLVRLLLADVGADDQKIVKEARRIRSEVSIDTETVVRSAADLREEYRKAEAQKGRRDES